MPNMLPLVSVIIPAYNAERFITETLDSVLSQSYKQIEILVVDDGSTDRTAELIHAKANEDLRIKLLQQSNGGVGAARNLAIQNASGEFIAPIDADDIWLPSKLERQVRCFADAGERTGLVYTWSVKIDESGKIIGNSDSSYEGDVLTDLIYSNFVGNASSPMVRRKCIEEVGGYSPHFQSCGAQGCEDWDFYLRIAEKFEFRCVKEFLTGYRKYTDSMSGNGLGMERSFLHMLNELKERKIKIPDRVLRWSASNFYYYLSGRCTNAGNYRLGLYWLGKSLRLDPIRLLSSRWCKSCLIALSGILGRPLSSQIIQRLKPWANTAKTGEQAAGRRTNQNRPKTLFDKVQDQRIAHVKAQEHSVLSSLWMDDMPEDKLRSEQLTKIGGQ